MGKASDDMIESARRLKGPFFNETFLEDVYHKIPEALGHAMNADTELMAIDADKVSRIVQRLSSAMDDEDISIAETVLAFTGFAQMLIMASRNATATSAMMHCLAAPENKVLAISIMADHIVAGRH